MRKSPQLARGSALWDLKKGFPRLLWHPMNSDSLKCPRTLNFFRMPIRLLRTCFGLLADIKKTLKHITLILLSQTRLCFFNFTDKRSKITSDSSCRRNFGFVAQPSFVRTLLDLCRIVHS